MKPNSRKLVKGQREDHKASAANIDMEMQWGVFEIVDRISFDNASAVEVIKDLLHPILKGGKQNDEELGHNIEKATDLVSFAKMQGMHVYQRQLMTILIDLIDFHWSNNSIGGENI